jgi:hypothetical protein
VGSTPIARSTQTPYRDSALSHDAQIPWSKFQNTHCFDNYFDNRMRQYGLRKTKLAKNNPAFGEMLF